MRAFFQYLFQRGVTETNLALCVPTIAQRWDARLPRFLSPEQIEALLAWVRDNPKHGLRDHAMLLMMARLRSEEHTSELQSLMRISYAVFCLTKKKTTNLHRDSKDTRLTALFKQN